MNKSQEKKLKKLVQKLKERNKNNIKTKGKANRCGGMGVVGMSYVR